MRIVCPDCAATYEVPDGMLAARPQVRCARCSREWHPEPAPLEPPPPQAHDPGPPPEPAPDAAGHAAAAAAVLDRPAAAPQPHPAPFSDGFADAAMPEPLPLPARRSQSAVRLAWAGSVLLLVLLCWAAYAWRAPIMQAWPPSERLYAAFGLA